MALIEDALESTSEASLRASQARSDAIEADLQVHPERYRMLTGDRPTGRLHIGHYFGSLANRVRLQNLGMQTWVLIADYQVIYDRDGVGDLKVNVLSALADYLAVGLDPARSTIFTHSAVPALNQLLLPFLSVVTDSELRRNPTVKDELASADRPMSGLMLTFPVHQAADILFCKANLVPVGKDQLPHIEVTRLIARRFDERYGRVDPDQPVFPQADALLSAAPAILGLDGTKMSKSKGNVIELGMTADQTAKLIRKARTDADRHISYDPVNRPEVSNLIMLAAVSSGRTPEQVAEQIGDGGGGGLKKEVTEALNEHLAPIRARRAELVTDPGYLLQVLHEGNAKANEVAEATLAEVRVAMQMDY
ncbi:MAG: tryptophan--tRNA ligase [Brooklawnia sp.]|uniref:tryptophan--tRNA ligase n=1 Tax=Brooklawnia sp. TaxID=2699740 RepID=UPI003C770DD4